MFSNTFSLHSSLNARDRVSHPHINEGVLFISEGSICRERERERERQEDSKSLEEITHTNLRPIPTT
jgi:hypothetical protein